MAELIKGVNDLASLFPEVAVEWDYEKNYPYTPRDFTAHSGKKVWWRCKLGHSFQSAIYSRTGKNKNGCQYCANKKVLKGFNDLATIHPEIAAEWDYEKNYPLRPEDVLAGTTKKVWWICKKGHSYYAQIKCRTRKKGTQCPYCSGNKVLKGFNDLSTLYPEVAAEWDYEKNYPLCPDEVLAHSTKKVWWRCKLGHSYYSQINSRSYGTRCPYCSGNKVLKGFNDLATLYPELANEWDLKRNYPLKPDEILAGSGKKVFWLHKEGESYKASIRKRVEEINNGIRNHAGRRLVKGYNDLAFLYPEIAAEWNYEKNYPLIPENVTYGSSKKMWWTCKKEGHSYQASVAHRTINKSSCPYCAGLLPIKGKTDLKTLFPDICRDWDYEKNKNGPDEYTSKSEKSVYWKCHKCNHKYRRKICLEVISKGCKKCK